ncbi:RNA polymerase sigma factor [Fulvivirga sp. M361]|nr:RNA polymerase sigma factor [Fulvivirga sp. M361]
MYYRCGDLDKAEDLMQEAFIRLWENCKKVIFEKAKSYLFTTANRLFLNQIEHEKVVLSFEKYSQPQAEVEDPEFQLRGKEFKAALEKAIADLPTSQREVFLMNRIDKMPFEEIADIQGVSVSAVHKKIYKALDRLRKSVDELRNRKI